MPFDVLNPKCEKIVGTLLPESPRYFKKEARTPGDGCPYGVGGGIVGIRRCFAFKDVRGMEIVCYEVCLLMY